MKSIHVVITVVFLFSISLLNAQDNASVVKDFLKEIPSAGGEKVNSHAPVASVDAIAKKNAAKTISLSKDNIGSALKEAGQFKYGIIVVGEHTFVKVSDFKKCSTSNSWGACMPYGEGYIKKGELVSQTGPINNIIGRPDSQTRTLYLFN